MKNYIKGLDKNGKFEDGRVKCSRALNPIDKQPSVKNISAFDIETYGDKNKFLMGSIGYIDKGSNRYENSKEKINVFWDKRKII